MKKSRTLILFLILVVVSLISHSANAQILNIEKRRIDQTERDTANFILGNAALSYTLNNRSAAANNPVKIISFAGNGDIAYYTENHNLIFLNNFNYFSVNANSFISTGFHHLRTNLFRKQKISYEAFAQFQYDLPRGLNSRNLIGGGTRFSLLENPKFDLIAGTGFMFEREVWANPENRDDLIIVRLPKSSNYISTRIVLTDHIDFNTITYYQTGFDELINSFRHRFSTEANLLMKINSKLSLRTTFLGSFENRPIIPITKFIYSVTNGIQVNF